MTKLPIVLLGASGRMGKEVAALIEGSADFVLVSSPARDFDLEQLAYSGPRPVIIDFSSVEALGEHVCAAEALKMPIVVCVSGVDEKKREILRQASHTVPVLNAPNTSIGANLVAFLSGQAAQSLESADIEVGESHHRNKKDSPSGTAFFLAEHIAHARKVDPAQALIFNRHEAGVRKPGEIGVFGLRGGSDPGTHTVYLFDEDETIEITHRVQNRRVFASRALKAASFLSRQPAGLYSMLDVFKMDSP